MNLRKIFPAVIILLAMCVPSWAGYDVNTPHVIINQIYGAGDGYMSHSFIELYNPTTETVSLEGWAVHYRSSENGTSSDKWYKTDLSGEIPSKHSYLIRGAADSAYETGKYKSDSRTLNDYDKLLSGGGKRNSY